MGIWDTLKQHAGAQFLELIQWTDDTRDTIVYRFPVFNQAITDKSKLVVREGQAAVFVSEGKLSDVFGPGTYTLDTRNTPILSFFTSIAYSLNYPYKGDIYFITTRQFTESPWGTPNPIVMRDAEFGMIRLRGHGVYSYRITDPAAFIRQVVGTDGLFTTSEINGQLKRKLVAAVADTIGQARIPILDLAAKYMDFGDEVRDRINPTFQQSYGVTITDFTIVNLTLPEEVEKALDTRTKMGVLGDLGAYTQLKAAEAIGTAAANPGMAGAAMGMGLGFGMGNTMGATMASAAASPGVFNPQTGLGGAAPAPPPPPPLAPKFHYAGPSGQAELSLDDVVRRVTADRTANHMVWAAGWAGWKAWADVPEIAGRVPPVPAAPPVPNVSFHYPGPGGSGEKTLAEVLDLLRRDPSGAHVLWKAGFDGWKPARDVDEVRAALASVPPPPPAPPPLR
jgi:membrane protease subunit (stomatin/prohibitin family)